MRESIQTFSANAKKVDSLRKGVAVMMQRSARPKDSADYRRSWEYWAAMHAYFGTAAKSGTAQQYAKGDPARGRPPLPAFAKEPNLDAPLQPAGLAKAVWDKCEHGSAHFVTWHRMYLYFFEQVLREAAGDKSLSLPYWDYSDPKQAMLPEIFRDEFLDAGKKNPNPLYAAKRTPSINEGKIGLAPESTTAAAALENNVFFRPNKPGQPQLIDSFSQLLEITPHGEVHCALGSGCSAPLMGAVPTSARDPIFYLHHANIDRLWSCWTNRWGEKANPIADKNWMKQPFSFISDKGDSVTMTVSELFDPKGRIQVKYEKESSCGEQPAPVKPDMAILAQATSTMKPLAVSAPQPINITGRPQSVPLNLRPEIAATVESATTMAAGSRREVLLKVNGLRARSAPGIMLGLYLADSANLKQRRLVSSINFFGRFDGTHSGHDAGEPQDYVFPANAAAAGLLRQGTPWSRVQVLLIPHVGVTGTSEDEIAARLRKEAELSIRSIELLVRER